MKTSHVRWRASSGWESANGNLANTAELVLVFADHSYFYDLACYKDLKTMFPKAHIVGCSSAGNALETTISDGNIVATAVSFEHGHIEIEVVDLEEGADIKVHAARIMNKLDHDGLRHVFVLSDGLKINGSELAKGLNSNGTNWIAATGGLAGDGSRFRGTWVMADAPARQGRIVAVGFYGNLKIKSGCDSGWEEFGAERKVTRAEGNIVYEIDAQPALALYKKYLGNQASELPSSGLRFPLSTQTGKDRKPIIRTLLAVNEAAQSLTFAGDVPEGDTCRLMKTNLEKLFEGATNAAKAAKPDDLNHTGLCLVVSCVGRRMVLGQETEVELELIQKELGAHTAITGFYSYGELAPFGEDLQCQLHNQTMTITTIYE